MAENEKISGDGVTRIFEELLQRKTLLELFLLDTDFQQPTSVTALSVEKNDYRFKVDVPEGFKEAAADIHPWRIRFEFTGKDNIKYSFKTIGGEITGNHITIKLPEILKRKQRRKLFRISAPAGTKLCFSINTVRYELDVIDISIGGSLAALVQTGSHADPKAPFADISKLTHVEFVFPAGICQKPVKIKTAQIKRTKKIPETPRYEIALEFSEITRHHENLLTDLVYRLQRHYLRKRLPMDI